MDLQGKRVYLRPVSQDDIPAMAAHLNDIAYETEFNFFSLSHPGDLERGFSETGLLGHERGELLVVTRAGDLVVGDVSYRRVHYGPGGMSAAYNIGIGLAPEQRGKGYGVEAQQLMAAYLFSVYPVMRVEASTDILNVAEQRALEKAGFTREGIMRKAQWRDGDWHDLVIYSILRGE